MTRADCGVPARPAEARGRARCVAGRPHRSLRANAWPGWPQPARWSRPAEIFTSHDGASFGNKMMWWPIVIVPTMLPAGIAAVFSRRAAKTVLPVASAGRRQRAAGHLPALAGYPAEARRRSEPSLQHRDGAAGVRALLASMVGGMGFLAALLRREGEGEWRIRNPSAGCMTPVTPGGRAARGFRRPGRGRVAGIGSPPGSCWPDWTPQPELSFFTVAEQATAGPCSTCCWTRRRAPRCRYSCWWTTG